MSRLAAIGLGVVVLGLACIMPATADPEPPATTTLKFEVRLAKGLEPDGRDGRLLIVLSKEKDDDLRHFIGQTGTDVPPLLGKDVKGLSVDGVVTVDLSAITYPIESLALLPRGDYYAQAVFECNRDLQVVDAPGNLYGDPVKRGSSSLTQKTRSRRMPRRGSAARRWNSWTVAPARKRPSCRRRAPPESNLRVRWS